MPSIMDISIVENILNSYLSEKEKQKIKVKLFTSLFSSKGVFAKGEHLKACYKKKERINHIPRKTEVTIYHDEIQDILAQFFSLDEIESFTLDIDNKHRPSSIAIYFKEKNGPARKLTQE